MNDPAMQQRIAMVLEFDGRPYHGWQHQDNAISVQQVLETALQRIDGQAVQVVAAGRTDAGVHASAMLVHADVNLARWQRSPRAYVHGCNSYLPESVRVTGVRAVAQDFHARFDCRGRSYRYKIWGRKTASALQMWRHWWMPRELNLEWMIEASQYCLGRQDFSALRAAGCQASHAVRCIRDIRIEQSDCTVYIDVRADAFLYHMVRILVGNLVEVGVGKQTPDAFAALLQGRNRSHGAATAPAHGLYFSDAQYDDFMATDLIDRF
ncbi:MAG: tRNA pseudouridine(38-40) synthase TruA [Mariprofundaceae bacterium]